MKNRKQVIFRMDKEKYKVLKKLLSERGISLQFKINNLLDKEIKKMEKENA